ncbi:MAG: terminase small subunit [Thermodesulfobacteriota bacterium]
MQETKLTAKQQKFVNEYLIDLNATQAAIRAGYSKKTAGRIGQENMQKLVIKKAIERAQTEQQQRTQITADQVVMDIMRVISKAEASNNFGATLKGLELLGKHLGMFTGKPESSGEVLIKVVYEDDKA